jgi:hypothetical protein
MHEASMEAAAAPAHPALDGRDDTATAASIAAARRCSRRTSDADWTRRRTAHVSSRSGRLPARPVDADEGRDGRDGCERICAVGSAYEGCESDDVHAHACAHAACVQGHRLALADVGRELARETACESQRESGSDSVRRAAFVGGRLPGWAVAPPELAPISSMARLRSWTS